MDTTIVHPARTRRSARTFAVHVDDQICDGCGICLFFCKPAVFELSSQISTRGVYPSRATRAEACNGCGLCELGCPQLAIAVAGGAVAERQP